MAWICTLCSHLNESGQSCSNCYSYNSSEGNNNTQSTLNNVYRGSHCSCTRCTFINEPSSSTCEMCRNPLDELFEVHSRRALRSIRIQSIDETVIPDDLKKDMTEAAKIREHIIAKQLDHNSKFTDPEFLPTIGSLGISRSTDKNTESVRWLRPEDLRGDEYSNSQSGWAVIRNPSSEDIVQGRLGNCWLLTGLALIADRSDLLERILITKEIDPHGIYQVRLCNDGMWTVVTIDDLFPANQFGQMIYSRANRKQLWVSLIEKAAAKLHGSYECLSLGYCADGLSTLTGSPCETFKLYDPLSPLMEPSMEEEAFGSVENISFEAENEEKDTAEMIWAKLLSAKDADFIMSVSCGSRGDDQSSVDELRLLGLRNLHAYAILDVRDIPSVNLRLLRLKNPWARLTWKGEWSDMHSCWDRLPNDIRHDLQPPGVTGESCGVFWISWTDVLAYFFALDICRHQSAWRELRMHSHLPWPVWSNLDDHEFHINVDVLTKVAIPESDFMLPKNSSSIPDIEENNTCAVLAVLEPTQLQIVLWQSNCRYYINSCPTKSGSSTIMWNWKISWGKANQQHKPHQGPDFIQRRARKNKPIDLLLVISKGYSENIGELVGFSRRQTSSYVSCDFFLDPGTYTIFYISLYYWQSLGTFDSSSQTEVPLIDFQRTENSSSLFECSLSIHSSNPVLLNRALLAPNMIPEVISKLAMSKGRKQLFGKVEVFTLMKGYSGMIMLVVNPAGNSKIRYKSDSSGSTNVRSSRDRYLTMSDDIISPGFKQITTVLTQDDAYTTYSLQHKYTASIAHTDTLDEYHSQKHWPPIQLVLHKPMKL